MNRPDMPDAPEMPSMPDLPDVVPDFVSGTLEGVFEALPFAVDAAIALV